MPQELRDLIAFAICLSLAIGFVVKILEEAGL